MKRRTFLAALFAAPLADSTPSTPVDDCTLNGRPITDAQRQSILRAWREQMLAEDVSDMPLSI